MKPARPGRGVPSWVGAISLILLTATLAMAARTVYRGTIVAWREGPRPPLSDDVIGIGELLLQGSFLLAHAWLLMVAAMMVRA